LSGASLFGRSLENDSAVVGSPLKKARASIAGLDDINGVGGPSLALPQLGDVLAKAEADQKAKQEAATKGGEKGEEVMEEEEL
jgi:hypothetical protein